MLSVAEDFGFFKSPIIDKLVSTTSLRVETKSIGVICKC